MFFCFDITTNVDPPYQIRSDSDRLGSPSVAQLDDVVEVVAHGHEQVEEELAAAALHLGLHGAAALERLAAADDEGEVVSAEPRVRVGRVVVGVLRRPQDGRDVDPALQALLAQRQALELLESELVGRAVHHRVAEQVLPLARDIHCGLDGSATACVVVGVRVSSGSVVRVMRMMRGFVGRRIRGGPHGVLELPRVAVLVVQQAGVVVALVEVLEDGREDLGLLVRERNPLALCLEVLVPAGLLEERRLAQDLLVGGEEAPLATNRQRDDRGVEGPLDGEGLLERPLQLRQLLWIPNRVVIVGIVRLLRQPCRLVDSVVRPERALKHGDGGGGGA